MRSHLLPAAALAACSVLAAEASAQGAGESAGEAPAVKAAPPPPAKAAPDRVFDAESWRARVAGRTLYYETPTDFMGKEYYPDDGSNRVVFIYSDGQCYDGTWFEEDGVFCFAYDALHCFRQFERGGVITVEELDGDTQTVVRMTDEVLSCAPELLS